jgi:hypothetical protein
MAAIILFSFFVVKSLHRNSVVELSFSPLFPGTTAATPTVATA